MSVSLFCFVTEPDRIPRLVAGGVAGLVVDWEQRGKRLRQSRADTQIAGYPPADLIAIRRATSATILCRINPIGPWSGQEIEAAIAGGADELLVPMVRRPPEVDQALAAVGGRIPVSILIETVEAVDNVRALARRPLARVYLGLNDLAIDRGSPSIFDPLVDGTLARVAASVGAIRFGFGGLTVPGGGHPIPTRLLLAEMARLGCDFTFLRRSFWRDTGSGDPAEAVRRIRIAGDGAARRPPPVVAGERAELEAALRAPGVVAARSA